MIGVAPNSTRNRRLIEGLGSAVTFIAPSAWMRNQALTAGVPDERVLHIPNPIDTSIFAPSVRDTARQSYGLSSEMTVIGWQPGKGNAVMLEALSMLALQLQPLGLDRVCVLSTSAIDVRMPIQVRVVPTLQTELERAAFWGACDIGVSATAMDNFPNVVIESLAVGTPFVIADVGGAAEAVKMSQAGIVLPNADANELAGAMHRLITENGYRRYLADKAGAAFADVYRPADLLAQVGRMYSGVQ